MPGTVASALLKIRATDQYTGESGFRRWYVTVFRSVTANSGTATTRISAPSR